jgi:hypothetical protein
VKYTKVNGVRESNTGMEYGKEPKGIHILASGLTQKRRVSVFTPGKTVINMRECGFRT